MPGIIEQAQGQPQTPAAPAGQPAAAPGEQKTDPAVQRVVIAAKKLLATPEIADHIVQMLKAEQDPATAIAKATIFLMQQLIEKSSNTMPPKAIVPAGIQVAMDIARIGQAAGVFKVTEEIMQKALEVARSMFPQPGAQPGQPPAAPAGAPAQPMGA